MNQRCCKECKYADWDADGCTCLIDKRSVYNAFSFLCDQFSYAKPMTNADRIRQMMDEELAKELTSLIMNVLHSRAIFYGKMTEEQITAANLKWLKQESGKSEFLLELWNTNEHRLMGEDENETQYINEC